MSTTLTAEVPKLEDLQAAQVRVSKFVNNTPVMTSSTLDEITGANFFFKCENFQKVGAFKFRGAINTLFQIPREELQQGVATHSSGNHAQAVALAAKLLGVKAHIVMPENSSQVKIDAVKGYGAEVTLCAPTLEARDLICNAIIEKTGARFISPYDDWGIIAGASTAAMELHDEIADLDMVIAPVGGGGLISGSALATHYRLPNAVTIAAEPSGADDAYRGFKSGQRVEKHTPNTICDGLLTTMGEKTFHVLQNFVDDVVTVDDGSVIHAMRWIWERMKIVVEPNSAVPLAAVFDGKITTRGKRIGVILSGGNVDMYRIPWLNR